MAVLVGVEAGEAGLLGGDELTVDDGGGNSEGDESFHNVLIIETSATSSNITPKSKTT